MRHALLAAALLLLASACGSSPVDPIPLSELDSPGIRVWLHTDGTADVTLVAYECFSFAGTALEDGQSMRQVETGSTFSYVGLGKGLTPGAASDCLYPDWVVNKPPADEPVTTFTFSDGTAEFSLGVNALGAPHQFLTPPAPLSLHWGQRVSLQWGSPSDNEVGDFFGTWLVDGNRRVDLNDTTAVPRTWDGTTLTITLPAAPPDGGPATMSADAKLEVHVSATLTIDHCTSTVAAPGLSQIACDAQSDQYVLLQDFPATVR